MRIIGGRFKSRRFQPPANRWPTRPTTDFAKEGLFNILQNQLDLEEIKILDLFAGTGNISFECVSRGAKDVTAVEKFLPCVKFMNTTSSQLQIEKELKIIRSDVFRFIKNHNQKYNFIFADPPYDLPDLKDLPFLIIDHILADEGLLVIEHRNTTDFTGHLNFQKVRNYGSSAFSFFG